MSINEFDIIKKYFSFAKPKRADVQLGVGDDGAVVTVPQEQQLVLCIDTLVAGVHFPENTQAKDIAYKAIAVNLSDLAAMGAEPAWVTLALTLPQADELWLQSFSEGIEQILNEYNIQLIGGDITHGPLTVSVQAHGFAPTQKALIRAGAKVGDKIYITGNLGDAALALQQLEAKECQQKLTRPQPRIKEGMALRGIASSCIDISDGLLADLNHILDQSKVGAKIFLEKIPLSATMKKHLNDHQAYELALTGGDDYELCFTVSETNSSLLKQEFADINTEITEIGEITATKQLNILDENHNLVHIKQPGYQHF